MLPLITHMLLLTTYMFPLTPHCSLLIVHVLASLGLNLAYFALTSKVDIDYFCKSTICIVLINLRSYSIMKLQIAVHT